MPCESEQRAFAQGEDSVRRFVRGAYPGIPEHDAPPTPPQPPTPPPPSRPRRKRLRIERARYVAPRFGSLLIDFLKHAFALLFKGAVTDREYCFELHWPAGYAAQETAGLYSRFNGVIGLGPEGSGKGFPAVFSVIEAPDVIHGEDRRSRTGLRACSRTDLRFCLALVEHAL